MVSRLALCAAVVTGLLVTPPAGAQSPDRSMDPVAQGHLKKAQRLFRQGRYDAAIAELKSGYRLDPHPDFLYAQAQAQRESGDCQAATETYRRFLEHEPPAEEARLARLNIERCDKRASGEQPRETSSTEPSDGGPSAPDGDLPASPTSPSETPRDRGTGERAPSSSSAPTAEPSPNASASTRTTATGTGDAMPSTDAAPQRTPWYTDWLGNTLAGAGILAGGGSALTLFYGESRAQDANEAGIYDRYDDAAGDARRLRIVGITTAAVAGALFIGGIIRYLVRDGQKKPDDAAPGGDALSRWDER